jgi:hypothetical protein
MAPSVTAWAHAAFPELRADRPYQHRVTTTAHDPNETPAVEAALISESTIIANW